jgi:predicted PurR-regulated permease PerM
MRIQNLFRLGFVGTLGCGAGLLIVTSVVSLQTIIVYVITALFVALGLEPAVSWLGARGLPRWAAITVAFIGVVAAVTGIIFAVVPVIIDQIAGVWALQPELARFVRDSTLLSDAQRQFPYLDLSGVTRSLTKLATDSLPAITSQVLDMGISLVNGLFGALIIVLLSLYFTAALTSIKRSAALLVPASKRLRFIDISEQMSSAVGRYVFGQGALALCNGALSFVVLSVVGAPYPALLALIAFLLSLIPLVGTPSGSVLIVVACLIPGVGSSPLTALVVALYYAIYTAVEAFVLRPRVMHRAVAVPGVLVVIAVLTGGRLLGPLGALLAIPVAAALVVLVRQVVVPRQNES